MGLGGLERGRGCNDRRLLAEAPATQAPQRTYYYVAFGLVGLADAAIMGASLCVRLRGFQQVGAHGGVMQIVLERSRAMFAVSPTLH